MVLGQLIWHCRIDSRLWSKILDFVTDEANDGYPAMLEYIEEPVNCEVDPIEGTRWFEITLGADSFREEEWTACHRIISCIRYAEPSDENTVDDEWLGEGSLAVDEDYLWPDPFQPTSHFKAWLDRNYWSLTPEQCGRAMWKVMALTTNEIDGEEEQEED